MVFNEVIFVEVIKPRYELVCICVQAYGVDSTISAIFQTGALKIVQKLFSSKQKVNTSVWTAD
jgi:hypothetical protein